MERLLLIAILATLATAKPGLYKEKEDFQYSRSSTDEGSKSGFYGAQRGNMGGNFERAHNMDGLAQHQMSGLVRQVEGELGEGSKTRTGSVFTAANTRGIYGSGHYDLSNLEGRNFQEGVTFGDSESQAQSHSSLTSQAGYNRHASGYNTHSSGYNSQLSGYNAQSEYNSQSADLTAQLSALNSAAYGGHQSHGSKLQTDYNGYQYLGHSGAENSQQQAENLHATNQHLYGHREANGYYSQSAYNGQSAYGQSSTDVDNTNSHRANAQTRVISAMPVRVVVRPGTRVVVPIAAQTYDASNSAAHEQSSVNSDAEVLGNQNQDRIYKPTGAKHYESSYSYRKQWEKHDTQPVTVLPVAVPTIHPFPKNSELYEDAQSLTAGQLYQATGLGSHRSHSHSSNSYSGYNANAHSALSSQSHHQSAFNAQSQKSASATAADTSASTQEQAVYNSANAADATNQIEDVDSKPKSYHSSYSYHKSWERQGDPYVIKPASSGYNTQASQRLTTGSSNQGSWSAQHYGSRYQQAHQNVLNMEDCDCDENGHIRVARSYNTNQQEEQNFYQQNNEDQEVLSQQSQNLEDLTQQSQNKWDKIEDLGQQSQNKWDKIEDLGQQSQNNWDQSEDLGQQAQNQWDQSEDLGQQAQNKWDQSEDLGQQTQSKWDKLEDAGQQTQTHWDKFEDGGQQTQNKWDKLEDLGQQTQSQSVNLESDQQTQSKWDNFDGQQSQLDVGQQLQNTWNPVESIGYHTEGQETQSNWDDLNTYPKPNNDRIPKPSSENDKKPLLPNLDSNLFGTSITTSPTEQSVQSSTINTESSSEKPHNPWNMPNIPFNSNSKYWGPSDPDNFPVASHNYFNRPWLNQFPYTAQSSEQSLFYNNHQTHTYNTWEHHLPSFTEPHPQYSWPESFINHHGAADPNPTNSAQSPSTLWNLWDKVDTIEKQTISTNKNKTEVSQNSDNSYIGSNTGQIGNNGDSTQTGIYSKPFGQNYGHNGWDPRDLDSDVSTSPTTSTTKKTETTTYTTPTVLNIKSQKGKLSPTDVGRGDIGPEDGVADNTPQSNSQEIAFGTEVKPGIVVSTSEHKRFKTPAEIEALSQVLDVDKTTTESTRNFKESTFGVSSHGLPEQTLTVTSSTTSRAINGFDENEKHQNTVTVESAKFDQSNLQQSVNLFGQQNEHFKQDVDRQFESHKLNAADTIPQKEQNENYNKLIHKVETTENSDLPTQTITLNIKPLPNTNTWNDNMDTPVNIRNSWFHNLPHNPKNGDQTQNNNYNNQKPNTHNNQESNIGEQDDKTEKLNENVGQKSESFGQVNENFGQQNLHVGQETENLEQQSENLGQETENFGQQSEDFGQQSVNFGQANENFEQVGNFGQISENFGQQSEDFGQQSVNFGQGENFEQSENLGQQSETFGQQGENFGQQSENFGQQSENLGQSAERHFGGFNPYFQKEELPAEQQFETFGQQVDKLDIPDTELSNLETQKQHKLQNTEIIIARNMHNTYNQQQSEKWNQYEKQVQTGGEHETPDEKVPNLEIIPIERPAHPRPTSIVTDTPPEPEKPGFWKSVGNKFVSAKDKVVSWFSRS